MIDTAISLLEKELVSYLSFKDSTATVVVDNIGLLETANGDKLANNIVITVVNVEEESTLKNQPPVRYNPPNNAVYQNPPVFLNLYVLFTSNYWGDKYIFALQRISLVVQFLQSKSVFSYAASTDGPFSTDPDLLSLRFTLELYTLTFEQLNHLWGSLGGRQIPFVMYKLRLVAISDRATLRTVPLITEIDSDTRPL
ncbi:DUF4255 domain-containing protein [Puia sp.]|uniref:DUF4255 domain-containing protein n=1 Tax=Puia sp. TaxID=2045100 RepID=UPI002F3F8AC3